MTVTAAKISSPCISVCIVDPSEGLCEGCGRTLHEIAEWGGMSEAERRSIMAGLPDRLTALGPKAAAPRMATARIKAVLAN